jgi:HAD superfamily hydrolase (TIGR01509 family)
MDALLLDYNGVIVNDEPLHFAAFRDTLAANAIALDQPTYAADYLGIDDRSAFVTAFRRAGRPLEGRSLARLMTEKAARYQALAARDLPLVPGVGSFAAAAMERWAVAVVSGALRREVESGLEQAGLDAARLVVVSAEDVEVTKPDPAGYRQGLRRLAERCGAEPLRAVVVEDSLPGLGAARAVGAGCVMLTTSHSAAALARADLVWSSFEGHAPDELISVLRPVVVR